MAKAECHAETMKIQNLTKKKKQKRVREMTGSGKGEKEQMDFGSVRRENRQDHTDLWLYDFHDGCGLDVSCSL